MPSLADVLAARRRIASRVIRTPLVRSGWLSSETGAEIFLKLESLQITNSFKLRGAWNAALAMIDRLAPGEAPPSLVTASAGNHGRALAHVAEQLGLHVTVFTPRGAPRTKLDAIAGHGADLRAVASTYEESERLAKQHAAATGKVYLSPYSHPDLLSGIGTIGLEIFEDLPSVNAIVVPVGGGGLISGVAAVVREVSRGVEVIGVEAEASHPFTSSLAAGHIVEVELNDTLADGLAGNMDPETITYDLVRRLVDRIVMVGEDEIEQAIRGLLDRDCLLAEGAGAVGVGAVVGGRLDVRGRRIVILITGSNIDAAKLASALGITTGLARGTEAPMSRPPRREP